MGVISFNQVKGTESMSLNRKAKEECGGLAFLFAKLSKIYLTSTNSLLLTNKTVPCDLCKSKYTCLIYIKDALWDKQPQIKVPEVKKFNFKINLVLNHLL